MHPLLDAVLDKARCARALSASEAAALLSPGSGHLPDLLALARVAASAGGAAPFTCGIVNAKSGACAEDCAFCAQSRYHAARAPVYAALPLDSLLRRAEALVRAGVGRMGLVASGATLSARECDLFCEAAGHIVRSTGIALCASFGLLRPDRAAALRQAGFSTYHHNLETSASHYPAICTTHGQEQRVATVRAAAQAGLRVCSGGVFGLGETWEHRLELAAQLQALPVRSTPVNFLLPIPGTPLQHRPLLPPGEALAIVAVLRLMLPDRDLVLCGGRTRVLGQWDRLALASGANGLMTGDYLTMPGAAPERDRDLLAVLGSKL